MGQEIKFLFKDIQIASKQMFAPSAHHVASSKYVFNIKVETKVLAEDKIVLIFVYVTISEQSSMSEASKLTMICVFELPEYENHILLQEDGSYFVPPNLDELLRTVSVSTARGILYSELRGTYLSNQIMPVVYLKDFKAEKDSSTTQDEPMKKIGDVE